MDKDAKSAKAEKLMQQLEGVEVEDSDKTKATLLTEFVLKLEIETFLDQLGDPYVTVPDEPLTALKINSTTFRQWVLGKHWDKYRRGFTPDTFTQVVGNLEGKTMHEKAHMKLFTRIARVGDTIYYDIGDGVRVVEIDAEGWRILDICPIKFRRYPHQKIQVTPEHGGNMAQLLKYFHLTDPNDAILLQTYIPTIMVPNISRVALLITGEQGAAKSTALGLIRSLVDPSHTPLLTPLKDAASMFETSSQHYCFYMDNLSFLKSEVSDALCMLVTGGSFSKRKLYTDDEQVIFTNMVALGLTAINLVANKSDLLDRSLILNLSRIPEDERLEEEEFWEKFEKDKPMILGAVFSTLSGALKIRPSLTLPLKPRMAAYAHYAACCGVDLGNSTEDFMSAFKENTQRQNQAALSSSATAQVILMFMEDIEKEWTGSSTDLHRLLKNLAEQTNLTPGGQGGFPNSAIKLWHRIAEVKPNLNAAGIEATRTELSTHSVITLRKITPAPSSNNVADVATVAAELFDETEEPNLDDMPF